uniref:ubiquitinyl hydrolase 1 n=1 Tax=Petromyzon marinus TaxID=7757 RepID=A0AAJ7WXM0_PETMA|nr:uncharacterized protein LOC116943594 isoform X2 [Petromyzon marinus]
MNEAQGSRYRSRECEQMDAGLAVLGLHRVAVARDSSSVYRVVAQEIFYTQSKHREVRRECAQFIQGNSDSLKKISKSPLKCIVNSVLDPRMPAGNVEMAALALLYRCDFLIYREPNKPPFKATSNGFSKKVMLCQRYEAKYDAVCSKQTYTAAAICQSIVYNLLYTHVFGVSPDVVAREVEWFRLQEETQGRQKESRHPTTLARDGKPLVGYSYAEKTSRKIIKAGQAHFPVFPFRVLKSLDSEIYRNVEFDVWIDSARGYTMTRFPVLEFSGGEKCEVQLKPGGRYYSASIQKINPNYQTVTVFIKALAQRHHVMLESVRAMGYQSASERMMGIQGASSRQLFEMPIQHRKHERYYGHLSHSYRQDYPSYSGRLTGSGSLYKGHSNGQHCKPPRKMERPPAHGSEERLGGVKSTGTAVQVELSSTSDVQEPNSGLTDFTGKYDSPGADQSEQTENGSNDLILDTHCVDKSEEGTEDPNVTPLNNPVVDGENVSIYFRHGRLNALTSWGKLCPVLHHFHLIPAQVISHKIRKYCSIFSIAVYRVGGTRGHMPKTAWSRGLAMKHPCTKRPSNLTWTQPQVQIHLPCNSRPSLWGLKQQHLTIMLTPLSTQVAHSQYLSNPCHNISCHTPMRPPWPTIHHGKGGCCNGNPECFDVVSSLIHPIICSLLPRN